MVTLPSGTNTNWQAHITGAILLQSNRVVSTEEQGAAEELFATLGEVWNVLPTREHPVEKVKA